MDKEQSKSISKNSLLTMALIMSLTLGLAPFSPEPHIIGKIKWIAGGGVGMEFKDYFDFVLHGTPWALLLYAIYKKVADLFN